MHHGKSIAVRCTSSARASTTRMNIVCNAASQDVTLGFVKALATSRARPMKS